jgi:4-hydroxy-tetrahydrodipicolinate synthase
MELRGCGTALVTPFHQDGSIDDAALSNLVAWQVESGIDFLIPCGTTGETPTLSRDEWLHVIDTTIQVVAGRVPVVAGATSNSTQEAVEKGREVSSRRGVNAILTATPYYNKPTQEGQYRHFKAIAEAVDKPLILYNVPGRTSANIEPGTLARLAEVPNIAVKEASGNISQIAEVLNAVPETFLVFSGDDAITLPVIALGGVGIISVASNEIPAEMAALTRAALNNDWTTARSIHRILPSCRQTSLSRTHCREGCAGDDGQLRKCTGCPAAHAARYPIEASEDFDGSRTDFEADGTFSDAAEFFVMRTGWRAHIRLCCIARPVASAITGKGRPRHDANHAKWHGPYGTLAEQGPAHDMQEFDSQRGNVFSVSR